MPIKFPNRKQIRLSEYDYSQYGYYFITICTQNRKCILGDIVDNKMVLNNIGKNVENIWYSLPQHHPIELDTFQIMPNHIHLIIQIVGVVRAQPAFSDARNQTGIARNAPTECGQTKFGHVVAGSLPCVIRSFKSETTKQIRRLIHKPDITIWQRNYYEHIVRNELELNKIREYITSNPLGWERDINNPISLRI